jgi:predicted phosphodiesterase
MVGCMSVIAIMSDIHGNLAALQAVLRVIDDMGCDAAYCLGDIVGYGASPNECVETVVERGMRSIMGNHDAAVVGRLDTSHFSWEASEAVTWTRIVLTAENFAYLLHLPDRMLVGSHAVLVHATPEDCDSNILGCRDLFQQIRRLRRHPGVEICFFGHTHIPLLAAENRVHLGCTEALHLDGPGPYLINPGSVGQPRDGNPLASFALWDDAERTVTFRRVKYDVESAQRAIRRWGLPTSLAERLEVGV